MLTTNIFGESLIDDFMDDFGMRRVQRRPEHGPGPMPVMRTDVKETENTYELEIDIPGVKKENVQAELKEGYLTVTVSTESQNEEKADDGKYLRKERFMGTASRSFYVGKEVKQDDIKAKFENGVLKLSITKPDAKPVVEENHFLTIEG